MAQRPKYRFTQGCNAESRQSASLTLHLTRQQAQSLLSISSHHGQLDFAADGQSQVCQSDQEIDQLITKTTIGIVAAVDAAIVLDVRLAAEHNRADCGRRNPVTWISFFR